MYTGLSATFNVYGRSFMRLEAVYLSGTPLRNTTFINPFSGVPKLSAQYPGFFGVKLLSAFYTTNFDNTITITIPAPRRVGYVDVIAQNPAGYGKLTQYVIKEPYANTVPLSTLRPWMFGVNVLSGTDVGVEGQIYTISGDELVTIAGDNIISI